MLHATDATKVRLRDHAIRVVESGVRRAIEFPSGSVTHLAEGTGDGGELAALATLERAGMRLGLLVLPAAVEDSFYRYNNLPHRLNDLYRGLDPSDPDEDLLEEAEAPAMALVNEAFLLDEVIDAIYLALRTLPGDLIVRRPGAREGIGSSNGRSVLLALKRLFRSDWRVESVLGRVLSGAGVGMEARPVMVHAAPIARPGSSAVTSAEASRLLGREVSVLVGEDGAVLGVIEP